MIGGAGAAEAVHQRSCRSRDGIVPPTANLEQIGDDIGLDVVAGEPRPIERKPVLSNSFGFGGHNATLILGPVESTAPPRPHARLRAPQRRRRRLPSARSTAATVSWFSLDGGKHRGAIGTAEGEAIERAVHLAVELGPADRRAASPARGPTCPKASPRCTRGAAWPRR